MLNTLNFADVCKGAAGYGLMRTKADKWGKKGLIFVTCLRTMFMDDSQPVSRPIRRLYDTSSHAFEVRVDTSSHGRRGAVEVGVTEGHLDHCGHMLGLH